MGDVLLVAMPWNRADYPSIQVGLLKGHLVRQGVAVRAAYPYLELESRLGPDLYLRLADKLHPILGESLFASMLDSTLVTAGDRYLLDSEELTVASLATVRENIDGFMRDLVASDLWEGADLVGFTCSFNQVYASLLAARELKLRFPAIRVVFGGAAMHGCTGRSYFDTYDFIDYLVSGPGEEALARLASDLPPDRMFIDAPSATLPDGPPDYDEFFTNLRPTTQPAVVLSASCGCTFGRCAFCAQNARPQYSPRSPRAVLADVAVTTKRYSAERVEFSDTCFPTEFFRGDWPEKMSQVGVQCFAQVRAFTSRSLAADMRRAGFHQVQVGIESFHSRTLARMNKLAGVMANIQCLRVAYASDVEVSYNLILDFPGTDECALEELGTLLPSLFHLQPPTALVPFALHHGSTVYNVPSRYGVTGIRPHRFYDAVSPAFSNGSLVPFFHDFDTNAALRSHLERIDRLCRNWISVYDWRRPALAWSRSGDSIVVRDQRGGSPGSSFPMPEPAARVFEMLDEPKHLSELERRTGSKDRLMEGLTWLRQRRLIVEDDRQILALPIEDGARCLRPPDELDSYFTPPDFTETQC